MPDKYHAEFSIDYIFSGDAAEHATFVGSGIEKAYQSIKQVFGPLGAALSIGRNTRLIELEGRPFCHGNIRIGYELGCEKALAGAMYDNVLQRAVSAHMLPALTTSRCAVLVKNYASFAADFDNRASKEEKEQVNEELMRAMDRIQNRGSGGFSAGR